MAAEPEREEERGPLPVFDLSFELGPLKIRLRINDRQLAGIGIIAAGSGLALLYHRQPQLVTSAITNAVAGPGLQVANIAPGSILVELNCHTTESFLSFMEDFETGKVMQRLNEEFAKIGHKGELEVTITNDSEVYKRLHEIREHEELHQLIDRIRKYKVGKYEKFNDAWLGELDGFRLNIVLFGMIGSGKSALIDTIFKSLNLTKPQVSVTTDIEGTEILDARDLMGDVTFYDTRGICELHEIEKGELFHRFDQASLADQIHVVLWVMKANDTRYEAGMYRKIMNVFQHKMRRELIPTITVITFDDEIQNMPHPDEERKRLKAAAIKLTGSKNGNVFMIANSIPDQDSHYDPMYKKRALVMLEQALKCGELSIKMRQTQREMPTVDSGREPTTQTSNVPVTPADVSEENRPRDNIEHSPQPTVHDGEQQPTTQDKITCKMSENYAVPLCLPNNCKWDEQTDEYSKKEDQDRTSLYVINAALVRLRTIEGPVCVVSIAGPCRQGKSYILSKVFDQGEVFPLGHELDPETMGIWMWIVPEKFKDASGQEFTVVLLDSEGIDAVSGEGSDDNCIFTLTILLASVLIYNSAGVPTRTDLDGLDYIIQLSQRIQMHSHGNQAAAGAANSSKDESKLFHKTFPFFMWLLRDVVLALPKGCHNIKDYFLSRVFKTSPSSKADKAKNVAESILSYFPGFDAFKLPPPSSDPEVVLNLNRDEVQKDINKSFLRGVEEFKAIVKSKLAPKHNFNEGEFVTGEALATMVTSYVTALNTPGTVPNVQMAWNVFVSSKCTQAKSDAIVAYDETMRTEMSGRMPCERDIVRNVQLVALDKALKLFEEKTFGISTVNIERYLSELTAYMENGLNSWQEENTRLTKESCHQLLVGLKEQHLDPVLTQLRGKDGAKVSFAEIMACYTAIEQGFLKFGDRGAEDVCAKVFSEFHPELQAEIENHMEHLQQLKDFDENLAYEKEVRAQEIQERKRVEEKRARLEEERAMKEREMELLKVKQEEERRRLEEQLRSGMEAQRGQMNNMMRANMDELQSERQSAVTQNKTLQKAVEGMQKSLNERNGQITNLERQIQEIANEPPRSPPPKKRMQCVVM